MSPVERPTDGPFPPDTRVRWLADNRAGVVVARPPGRTGDGVFVVFDGTETAAHIDPRTLTRDAVDRTDGPDTALADAIAWFRTVADVHAEMRFYEAWGHAATIVRAVLARPAAGRDLTARDVAGAVNAWERGSYKRAVVEHLNGIARPAVARTDGQCTCGDPSAADLVHHTEAPCRTVEELRTGRTDGQPHPDPRGRYDVPDPYDHPGWPLVSRIVAIATDTAPTMPNETDGVDNAVTGLLADQSWRDHVAMADVMGLVGDWGTDDVVQAVTDALHEYPRLRALVARTDGQPRTGADLADQRRRERETGTGPFRDDPLSTVERMGAAPADDTVRLGPAPIEWGELFTGVLDDLISKVIRDVGDLELLRNRAAVELGKIVVERAVTGPRPADDTVAAADGRPPADPEDGPWAALVRELKAHADQVAAGDLSGLPATEYQCGLVDGYRGAAGRVRQLLIQQSAPAAPADDTAAPTPFTVGQEVRSASGVRGTVRTANHTDSLVTWSNGNVVWVRNDEIAPVDDTVAPIEQEGGAMPLQGKRLSGWNYRVVRLSHQGETLYGIHEAYYEPLGWTAAPVAPVAESVAELRDVLARMAVAPELEVIDGGEVPAVDTALTEKDLDAAAELHEPLTYMERPAAAEAPDRLAVIHAATRVRDALLDGRGTAGAAASAALPAPVQSDLRVVLNAVDRGSDS